MESEFNNVNTILQIGETWKGEAELCSGYVVILVYIQSSKRCTLKVSQSDNKSNYNFNETVEYLPVIGGSRFQIYRAGLYCYVEVLNDSGEIIPDLVVRTHFLDIGRDSSIHTPTVVTGIVTEINSDSIKTAVEAINGKITACNTGSVTITSQPYLNYQTDNIAVATLPPITGSVTITSQPHLSYLTDNIAVTTMPAITGTVSVSSQPHLSYLTDNVAVVTMPAITGTVSVSSQPHLSYLTDNVAVATQPALTFSTDKVDVSGSSISVSSGAITETNSGSIKTAVEAINGKITACNTGSVTISSALPTGSNTIGNVYSYESPAQVANLTGISTIGQTIKNSPGSLMNLTVFNDGNAISYVKIYNVALPTNSDIPVLTLPVRHDSPINTLGMHNIQFSTAIGVRATANFMAADNNAPNGTTSVVAFYNGVAP